MEYEQEFAKSFMRRTLEIAKNYECAYDATLLVNCLLGLLIVPKESLIETVPAEPLKNISNWGIKLGSIKDFGKCDYGHKHEPNLRQIIRRLRNAVAHFKIEPMHRNRNVVGFKFQDRNGFKAELTLKEIHDFVSILAEHLEANA